MPYRHCFAAIASLVAAACAPRPRPVCDDPANREEQLWCVTIAPDRASELPLITAALSNMRHLGGECAHLANTVQLMLSRQRVHLFNRDEYAGAAGLAPIGMGPGSWLLLLREVVSLPVLQQVLAHEADHIDGEAHVDSAGTMTLHSMECGGAGAAMTMGSLQLHLRRHRLSR